MNEIAAYGTGDNAKKQPVSPRQRFSRTQMIVLAALAVVVLSAAVGVGAYLARVTRATQAEEHYLQACSDYETSDFTAAEENLRQSLELEPSNAPALALLGRTLESGGDLEATADAYESSLRLDPKQPEIVYRLAVVRIALGEREWAIESLERLLSTDAEFVPAMLLLAQEYERSGRLDEAAALYEQILGLEPAGVDLQEIESKLGGSGEARE